MRTPGVLLALAAAASACGPSGSSASTVKVLSDGDGDAVVKTLDATPGLRLEYVVAGSSLAVPTASEVSFAPPFQLTNGVTVAVMVTDTEDVYVEEAAGGRYFWGADDTGLLDTPLLEVKLPLKANTEWETGDAATPNWYRYRVEAVEALELPGGSFTTARLLQVNTKTGDRVTRWYAERVGLVARRGNGLETKLTRVTAPAGGAP